MSFEHLPYRKRCCMLKNMLMLVLSQQHTVRFPLIKEEKVINRRFTGMIVPSANFTPFSSLRTVLAVLEKLNCGKIKT